MKMIKKDVENKKQHLGVSKTVAYFGGVVKLAKILNTNHSNVSKWLYGEQPMPIKHAIKIERLTKKEIKAKDLRPDIFED